MSKINNVNVNTTGGLFRRLSIKRKLVLIMMLVSSVAMLSAGGAFITVQWWHVIPERMVDDISAQAAMVADNCIGAISFDDAEDAKGVLNSLKAKKPILLACVYRPDGSVFAAYRRTDFQEVPPKQLPKEEGALFTDNHLVMLKDIVLNKQVIGKVYMKSDLSELSSYLKQSTLILALVILLISLLAYLMASRLQRIISTPLYHLTSVAEEISLKEDYSMRARKSSDDEIGVMTDAFNAMLGQVQKRDSALRDSEERFQAIANYTYDWESWHGTNGRLLWTNPAVERITGYSIAECLTMPDYPMPLVHEADAEEVAQLFADAAEKRTIGQDYRFRIRTKKNEILWMAISWQPIYDSEGICQGFRSSMRDITARKKAEIELNRLRNYQVNIINSMPSVLVGVDVDGGVTQWNQEAERVTGVSAAKAQGQVLHSVYPQLKCEMEKVRRAIRERKTLKDQKIEMKNGDETRFFDVTVYPLIANGVEGAVIRVDDITERVRIEEMMIQSEKMLSVGGLAAGMAHEINNPLAGILQNTQVMRNRTKSNMPKNIRTAEACGTTMEVITAYMEQRGILDMIESIMESGRRAAQIVDNMLSFSRKGESRLKYDNIIELLDKTVSLASNDYDLKKKYDFRQIEIIREYEDNIPEIPCEGSKLQQVFLNLLKNGAQAMAERHMGGETSRFILRIKKEYKMLRIEIEDNGPGLAEGTRTRIFEPFFTTKGVGIGTGLGLSVSYFIITENHKGTMAVESTPNIGTNFIIRLPLKREEMDIA